MKIWKFWVLSGAKARQSRRSRKMSKKCWNIMLELKNSAAIQRMSRGSTFQSLGYLPSPTWWGPEAPRLPPRLPEDPGPPVRRVLPAHLRVLDAPASTVILDRVPPRLWKSVDSQKLFGHLIAIRQNLRIIGRLVCLSRVLRLVKQSSEFRENPLKDYVR